MGNSSSINVQVFNEKTSSSLQIENVYKLELINNRGEKVKVQDPIMGKFYLLAGQRLKFEAHYLAPFKVDLAFIIESYDDEFTEVQYLESAQKNITVIYTQING